ncbi:hypothetical protein AB0J01_27640 [Streptomyces sp. NPDC050204]|uniref:hypothetical protein n=1 Tax=Streptomyces sp. NPDC050204 TaxID=3155514 RepID=UPI0034134FA5
MADARRCVYLDDEFDPRNPTLSGLLALGLTDDAEHPAEYYAINADADLDALVDHPFILDHVLPYLPVEVERDVDGTPVRIRWDEHHPDYARVLPVSQIADDIAAYFPGEDEPELLARYGKDDLAYLHRLFGNDWGTMPRGVPRIFTDLEVLRRQLGAPQPPVQLADEHHALADARFNRDFHERLLRFQEMQRIGVGELAQQLYAAFVVGAGKRPAQPARPAGQPRPAWSALTETQRHHHERVAQKLLAQFDVRRPQGSR